MAAGSLIHIASLQLRRLLIWTPKGIASVTQESLRFCQDDSKQRKQRKLQARDSTSNKKIVRSGGPAVNLLERDLQDIIQEQQKPVKLQERSSLQRRLDLLLSLGCTMDQIQDRVKVLDLSEQLLLQRATLLKDAGCRQVTVDLLLSSYHTNVDKLRKHLIRREELEKATCTVLQCSHTELMQLKREKPSLRRFRCLTAEDIMEKAQLLHEYGITSKEIKDFPAILNIKVENIRHRLDTLKALRDNGTFQFEQYPLNIVAERTRDFQKSISRAMAGQVEIDGSPISFEKIAQRLGVTEKDIEDASLNFYKIGPSSVLKKIDYLLEQGLSNMDILSHIYMMKYRLETIQWAVEKSKEMAVSNTPSIYVVLSLLRSGKVPQRSFVWSRQRSYIASLLGVPNKMLPSSEYFRPLWTSDRMFIKRNFDFLVSEDFSLDDIFSCLILLAHDPDTLKLYYNSLWERPELQESVERGARADKKQTLSLLQYIMEKDMNFTSVVFHAEVEYDQGQVGGESHDQDAAADGHSEHQETLEEELVASKD